MQKTSRRRLLLGSAAWMLSGCRDKSGPSVPASASVAPSDGPAIDYWAPPHRIEHIVLIIKENRTYDTIFADLAGGDGAFESLEVCPDELEPLQHGRTMALRDKAKHRRCRHAPEATPYYHALARSFTLCDRFFSEVRGPSFPNHQMLVAGVYTELDDPGPPHKWRCPTHCYSTDTFPEQLARHGRTWRAYAKEAFVPAFEMYSGLANSSQIVSWRELEKDARTATLPNMSWVYCEFGDSEHPPASLCRGEHWTRRLLDALIASPQWPRTAVFVLWDDWGGFWDHVEPPVVERDRQEASRALGTPRPALGDLALGEAGSRVPRRVELPVRHPLVLRDARGTASGRPHPSFEVPRRLLRPEPGAASQARAAPSPAVRSGRPLS
ncbi:MAG: alkaline phosphatase family protein [Polyangiaceae bacterium]